MRIILIFLLFTFPATGLIAQFNVTGTDIYYNSTNTFLGVNTSSPATHFHVNGQIAATAGSPLTGFVQLWSDNSIIWKSGNANGGLRFGSATDLGAGNYSEKMRLTDAGFLGIATGTPQAYLDLGPGAGVKALFYGGGGTLGYYWGTGVNLGPSLNEASIFIGGASGACCGPANFSILTANQTAYPYTTYTTRFLLNSVTGNVGIGTLNINDANFKLFVETGIRTRKIKVDQSSWPDYVFHPGYPLLSLDSLHHYVQVNHHLPDIPTADSVAKTGLDLGDNQAALLKKIEELTLYVIELNKKVAALEKQLTTQKKK